jgi:hypothetical protein
MHRPFVISALMAFVLFAVLFGCQTTQPQPGITRADILRTLDGGELALSIALGFAEVRGASPDIIADIRTGSMLAFDAARAAVSVDMSHLDKDSLTLAISQIRAVSSNVLALCEQVGVSPARVQAITGAMDGVYAVIESAIAGLEDRG